MKKRTWIHGIALGVGLAALLTMRGGDTPVRAQTNDRSEDAALTLAGRKIRIDAETGRLRNLSEQEARELISTLTAMTTRSESEATGGSGATLVQMNGFDHVLVGRPNEDGSVDVQCVANVDDAVSFLAQTPKSNPKE